MSELFHEFLSTNFTITQEIKKSSKIDILPMPKGRGFLDTNDTCLLK